MRESIVLYLFVLWTMFGSFSSVIIYRLKSWEKWIWWGRSHCAKCHKTLSARDLVPLFSYLLNIGKCRQCDAKISSIYPVLEIVMGLSFALVWYFWVDMYAIIGWESLELFRLMFLLFIAFLLVVFTFYDILFLEIPEEILVIAIMGTFLILCIQTLFPSWAFLPFWWGQYTLFEAIVSIVLCAAIIMWFYIIMIKELPEKYDLGILLLMWVFLFGFKQLAFSSQMSAWDIPLVSGTLAAYCIFLFFFFQIYISWGTWMGGWDLRIAILMGLLLGASFSFYGIMITYITGSIVGIGIVAYKKLIEGQKWRVNTMIPFWPFLATGIFITLLFYPYIDNFINLYK